MSKKLTSKARRRQNAMIRPTSDDAITVLDAAAKLKSTHGSIANAVVQLALATVKRVDRRLRSEVPTR